MNPATCLFVLATLVALATAERTGYGQGPSPRPTTGGYQQTSGPVFAILRDDRTQNGYGEYTFEFDTENGIYRQESGTQNNGQMSQGGWQYTSPEGIPIELTFVADYNGYQPTGAHIPVSVPLPYQRTQVY